MVFEDNNYNSNSIFEQKQESYPTIPIASKDIPAPSRETSPNLIEELIGKLVKKPPSDDNENQVLAQTESLIRENEELFVMLAKFDCKIIMQVDGIIIECPSLDLSGKITLKGVEGTEFDDNVQKIFEHIAKLTVKTEKMEESINSYEEQEFYPVGDLEKETIIYQGKEVEALKGVLANPKKKLKKYVYFYNGKEITPDP